MDSVISFPVRGSGGRSDWPGNCAPQVIEALLDQYQPTMVRDPMIGSGTTVDVCTRRGLAVWGVDLHMGFDALTGEWPMSRKKSLTFIHAPYAFAIQYSGKVWGSQPDPRDPSTWPPERYGDFINWQNQVMYRAYESMLSGDILAVLVADVRKHGVLYPIVKDMNWYGDPEACVVKIQHNVSSNRKQYAHANFVAIHHEYLVITRRPRVFCWTITGRKVEKIEVDIRRFERAAWPALVVSAMQETGGRADLATLYAKMAVYARVKLAERESVDWQAQVRRILQQYDCFEPEDRGIWRLAATPPSGPAFSDTPTWAKSRVEAVQ
jgi:hypothetical protein